MPFNGAGWILKLPLPAEISASMVTKGYFKKNTALSKSQATSTVKARIRVCKFFWRALRGLTCTLPRSLSVGKVADKRTTNEGYFRPAKIREQRSEQLILSTLCSFVTFRATISKDRNNDQ